MIGVEKIIDRTPKYGAAREFRFMLFAAGNEEAEMLARLLCIGAQPASVAIPPMRRKAVSGTTIPNENALLAPSRLSARPERDPAQNPGVLDLRRRLSSIACGA